MSRRGRTVALLIGLAGLSACGARPGTAAPPVAPQLCVVRHAQAFRNLKPTPAGMTVDQLDALTPEGEAQAERAGERLPAGALAVYASPARRTRQTAARVAPHAEALVASELRSLEGSMPYVELEAAWRRGEDPRPPDGESLGDGLARVRSLLRRVQTEVPADAHVVFVTHGDIAPLIIGESKGTPPLERPFREGFETGQVVCLPRPR